MTITAVKTRKESQPEKLTTVYSGELKVLYDIFLALKLADDDPTPINAKRITKAYITATQYYDKREPRRKK